MRLAEWNFRGLMSSSIGLAIEKVNSLGPDVKSGGAACASLSILLEDKHLCIAGNLMTLFNLKVLFRRGYLLHMRWSWGRTSERAVGSWNQSNMKEKLKGKHGHFKAYFALLYQRLWIALDGEVYSVVKFNNVSRICLCSLPASFVTRVCGKAAGVCSRHILERMVNFWLWISKTFCLYASKRFTRARTSAVGHFNTSLYEKLVYDNEIAPKIEDEKYQWQWSRRRELLYLTTFSIQCVSQIVVASRTA